MARNQQLSPTQQRGGVVRSGDPFTSFQREMNRLFDDVFRGFGFPMQAGQAGEGGQGSGMMLQPDIDVSETEKEFKICADLPGVSERDVDVSLHEDTLTIRAERREERKEDKENFHIVERSHGMFQRSLRLPANIEADKVEARFENGVLVITLPKSEEAQRSRRIQVQASNGERPMQQQQQQSNGNQRQGSGGQENTQQARGDRNHDGQGQSM